MIAERIEQLRSLMKKEHIDVYVVPTGDFHGSEYISDYFQSRRYITGFTGSAGTAVIAMNEAVMWTDGRYFLQAERELADSRVKLFRQGERDVPELAEYISEILQPNMCVAFDGRTMIAAEGLALAGVVQRCGASLRWDFDAIGSIWQERPQLQGNAIFAYDEQFAGISRQQKLETLRKAIADHGGGSLFIAALDDIAWLLNLRGSDIPYNPVFFAYLMISKERVKLFALEEQIDQLKNLCPDIEVARYDTIYAKLSGLEQGTRILLDRNRVNFFAMKCIPKEVEVIEISNAFLIPKVIKNEIEVQNIRRAHLQDGAAVTKFMYRLKKRLANGELIGEFDAAKMIEEIRSEMPLYQGPSFAPIMAYAENGAIVHYAPCPQESKVLQQRGFLLADTGGQYLYGTTDVTRTIALGELTYEQKKHYTAVLRGHINLATARFPEGTMGANLDGFARRPLWQMGLDYNHGTGHGVGCFLTVHEGPVSIRWRNAAGGDIPLSPGMLMSNEPGVYFDGKYGIRLENLILCLKHQEFLAFETVTLVPFEQEAILPDEMTAEEKSFLNDYHQKVRNALMPYMENDEAAWLIEVTAAI